MNFVAQLCGIALTITMFVFIARRPSLGIRPNRAFLIWLVVSMIGLCLDIASVLMIIHDIAASSTVIVSRAYLVALELEGLGFVLYTRSCITDAHRSFGVDHLILFVLFIIGAVVTCALPIELVYESDSLYSTGAGPAATYVIVSVFIIFSIVIAARHLSKKRRDFVFCAVVIVAMGSVVQFFFKQLLVVSFGVSIAQMVIFLGLEDPELYIDNDTELWERAAALRRMEDLYSRGRQFSVLAVWLENNGTYQGAKDSKQAVVALADSVRNIHTAQVFRANDDEIWLICPHDEETEVIFRNISADVRSSETVKAFGGVRIGIACMPDSSEMPDAEDIAALLRHARWRCEGDANGVRMADASMLVQMNEELSMMADLDEAIRDNRIEVWYQPIWSIDCKRFVSAEALARMRAKDGTLIPPVRFIPLAERNGMISKLGERVFELVCDFYSREELDRYGIEYIEVNLSAAQCDNPELADIYNRIMDKYGLDHRHINLEITESATNASRNVLLSNMEKLGAGGTSFSLDDFGTGQSNLDYIANMPVEIVKFDRVMSQSYFDGGRSSHVMSHAIGMIQDLDMHIVAEGIEQEEQLRGMEALGVNYIQGYYFSKPLPEDEFVDFIQRANKHAEEEAV